MNLQQKNQIPPASDGDWQPENMVVIDQRNFRLTVETICRESRYPFLGLRLLIHVITGINSEGRVYISARQLSRTLDVNYDTVTKCLKDLRELGAIQKEKNK